MRYRGRLLSILVLIVLSVSWVTVHAQPSLFAPLQGPDGIASDPNGNVYVVADAVFSKVLVTLTSNGNIVNQVPLPGTSVADTSTNNMVYDPVLGEIWLLKGTGDLFLVNPTTGAGRHVVNVGTLPVDLSSTYDVTTGTVGRVTSILPLHSFYGDIAVLWRGNQLDVLVSGVTSVQPFVMRIRFVQGTFMSATTFISSTAVEVDANQPRGVAINAQGTVLTTMPIASFGEHIYAFSIDFPESQGSLPMVVAEAVLSSGMDTDGNGNFYISGHNLLCNGDTSALLIVPAGLTSPMCLPSTGSLFGSGYDVTVSPAGTAYTTMPFSNGVWRW